MIKQIVLSAILISLTASPLTDPKLPEYVQPSIIDNISDNYEITPSKVKKILSIIDSKVNEDFPRKYDVLAIIAIESRFKEGAYNKSGAKGLMQILFTRTRNTEDNIEKGIQLLRTYKKRLGSEKAAIHAYNIGIGAYLNGNRATKYYDTFIKTKQQVQKW